MTEQTAAVLGVWLFASVVMAFNDNSVWKIVSFVTASSITTLISIFSVTWFI